MTIGLDVTVRDSRLQAVLDAIDAGASNGTLSLYAGTRPATGGDASGNTLLGTLTFSDPAGTITNGVLTFSTITDDTSADADGTLAWARIADSDGTFVMDMDCGTSGSGAEIIFNTLNVVTGGTLQIISASINEGNA